MLRERLDVLSAAPGSLPHPQETTDYLQASSKPSAYELLREADAEGRLLLQPRSGVGGHGDMVQLLQDLELGAQPDIQSVTIDSHTRLEDFQTAFRVLNTEPEHLNGYPLPSHGFRRGRELNDSVGAPLEVRHGSPRARVLFEVSLASGFTAFEGGGLTYNLPYAKNVCRLGGLQSNRLVIGGHAARDRRSVRMSSSSVAAPSWGCCRYAGCALSCFGPTRHPAPLRRSTYPYAARRFLRGSSRYSIRRTSRTATRRPC